jgi:hypothetical protein
VIARRVFYNNSALDGDNPLTNPGDDNAIAADKSALLPGQSATPANVTSYSRGINGVMIDVAPLPDAPLPPPRDNFEFAIRSDIDPSGWVPAPGPALIALRRGAGLGGSDRLVITFPDGAIRDTWLRVTVRNTARTGLASPDVFYFGNLVGDSGGAGAPTVNSTDLALTRANVGRTSAAALSRYDFNRDGRIDAGDVLIVRNNQRHTLAQLTAPPAVAASQPANASKATSPAPPVRATTRPSRRGLLDSNDANVLA